MKVALPITVVAFETDFGGVVSNTRYLEYIERGRYALLHKAGLKISEVWESHGVQPVVRRISIEYLSFARHEDELQLQASVIQHSRTTTMLSYECYRTSDGKMIMAAVQTLNYINRSWRPTRVPKLFREALTEEWDVLMGNSDDETTSGQDE